MDKGSNIRLNPDAVEDMAKSQVPLSDRYGLPVFAADTWQRAKECRTQERQTLTQIRQRLPEADGPGEEESLRQIKERLFGALPGLAMPERYERVQPSRETWIVPEMAVITFMVLLWGLQKLLQKKVFRQVFRKDGRRKG